MSLGGDRSERTLVAETHGAAPTELRCEMTRFNPRQRLVRAAKIFLPLLGAALLSLPIPAWHLAAVPGFLIVAVVLAIRRLREAERVELLAGKCPACRSAQQFAPPPGARFPATLRCAGCGAFLKVGGDGSPTAKMGP